MEQHSEKITVVFWKWKLWNSAKALLDVLKIKNQIIDDQDWDQTLLDWCEQIVISPWVPQTHQIYTQYSKKIIWDYDLVWDLIQKRNLQKNFINIWVTGTDWKSSICWILYNIFEKITQRFPEYKAWIGWNYDRPITDIFLEILQKDEIDKKHILILEISSFMGYNIKNFKFYSSIWSNFEKDHLNWHPNMQEYFNAKLNVIKNTLNKWYVNHKILPNISLPNIKAFDEYDISQTHFIWEHNKQNLSACYLVAQDIIKQLWLKVSDIELKDIINQIKPLSHRIQLVKNINWIDIYDDGKSTTANSLNAALSSFDKKVILIAGWSDKWDDFSVLKDIFTQKIKSATLIWQTAPKIWKILDEIWIEYVIVSDMTQAVNSAYNQAINWSDTIVFSPGCASFDMFKNREDRVNQFLKQVELL